MELADPSDQKLSGTSMLQATDYDLPAGQIVLQSQASSSAPPNPGPPDPEHEFEMQSRPDTPENDLLDEPPSTLASRIIRAQDNPSPPPTVSPSNRTTPSNKYRLIDVSEPATPFCGSSDLTLSLLSPTWGSVPAQTRYAEEITPSRDLITFDVGNVPETTSTSPSNSKEVLKVAGTEALEANLDQRGGTSPDRQRNRQAARVSNSDTQEGPNTDPLSTPVRSSSQTHKCATPGRSYLGATLDSSGSHLDSPANLAFPAVNAKSRGIQQLTTSEELFEKQSPVEATQAADTALKDSSEISRPSPGSLGLVADRRDPAPAPSPAPRTSDLLAGASPDKNLHPRKPFVSNDIMSTSPTLPSSNFPSIGSNAGSPARLQSGRSSKPSLVADPPRTPARRMLIEEAPPSHSKYFGALSKPGNSGTGSNLGFPRTPVFHIPLIDSPARRILVSETNNSHHLHRRGPAPHNLTRSSNRSQSAEPSFLKAPPSLTKVRSNSVEPLPATQQVPKRASTFFKPLAGAPSITKVNKLPFPLVAEVIPEESVQDKSRSIAPKPLESSSTSTLKQGASRIPRIGSKPYSRPSTRRTITNTFPGTSIFNGKSSQSSELASNRSTVKPTTNPRIMVNELPVGLKRKRSHDETSTSSKPPTIVLPLQIFKPVAPQVSGVNKVASNSLHTSLENSPKVPLQSDTPSNTASSISLSQHTLAGDDKLRKNNRETVVEVECISEQSSFIPPTGRQEVSSTSDLSTQGSGTHAFAPEPQVEGYDEPTSSSEIRRTTRTRKKVQPVVSAPSSRSSQSRRKASKAPAPIVGNVFSGMTAVALKTLTNANTVRNQQYIAAKLETEVIRKLGCRPTSPTVKVQTVLQRAQDEKSRSRRERAQRRAQGASRRYDSEDPDELELPTFTELDTNAREKGLCSDSHRRGAGEDEDYKTPERQLKRLKLTDDSDPDEIKEGRRVKWDRGLFKAVYIDDVRLGTRPLSKAPASRKGCLAFASKAVQLDTMGNLPNANTAVVDLVEESIIIKKYVYDDDEEEEAPPVPKATRSKSRKSKS